MMRRMLLLAIAVTSLTVTVLAWQQPYPNVVTETVFENERVLVQRPKWQANQWAGEHSHAGTQLVVVLREGIVTYREGGKEWDVTRPEGEVFWRGPIKAHDHKPSKGFQVLLITIK